MPINFIGTVLTEGTKAIPYYHELKTYGPPLVFLAGAKYYFAGRTNTWERDLHGRVVLITGGTSGVGAVVAREMAQRGAQVIFLVRSITDSWTVNYISELREKTGNPLIYGEKVDLGDLFSIRQFATKWLDNSPPRRLDMVICCAATANPMGSPRRVTDDGLEQHLQINYLGHYHLLTLLSPSFRVQPPDRDVRIVLTTCFSSLMASFDLQDLEFVKRGYPVNQPWKLIGASKLALGMLGYELQRNINAYERPDKALTNVHVSIVDPGMMRSPSFRKFTSFGTLWGLLLYIILWPVWWFFLKTSINGAESVLYSVMSPDIVDTREVTYVAECQIRDHPPRKEYEDEQLQKKLSELSEKLVLETEKKSVIRRKVEAEREMKRAKAGITTTPPPKQSTDSVKDSASKSLQTGEADPKRLETKKKLN